MLQTPDVLVNRLHTRASAPQVMGITQDDLLDERARELLWEGWYRNDLIRYGLFEKEYPLPNDNLTINKVVTRRLYPIPISEINRIRAWLRVTGIDPCQQTYFVFKFLIEIDVAFVMLKNEAS